MFKTETNPKEANKMKTATFTENLDYEVEVKSFADGLFTVRYGKGKPHTDLDYVGACAALGECLMHSMRCAGNIEDPNA